jgi:tRNA (adenine37-N6)-methyltransferase
MQTITLNPIGYVRGGRINPIDDRWNTEVANIELAATLTPDALLGIEAFSHVEVVYFFHQVEPETIENGARHPRGNKDWPRVGIFVQCGRNRPNRLAVSVARIIGCQGTKLTVSGLDAIDGTPVLDIKPVMSEFLPRGEIRQPNWSRELMKSYWE